MTETVSVITCARQAGDSANLAKSLRSTLGSIKFEMVEMVGQSSMGSGYNSGVSKARGTFLVFTHADVTVWANRLLWDEMIAILNRPNAGFVGVAGSQTLSDNAVWWEKGQLLGSVTHKQNDKVYTTAFGPCGQALVMDGVFLACHRNTLDIIGPWNEQLGWHFYDIDMTLRATKKGLINQVVSLPICHDSIGELTGAWYHSKMIFSQGYSLPASLEAA